MAASDSAAGLVQATSPGNGVRLIALNRPDKRNALSKRLIAELLGELDAASKDPAVTAIVLTGNGPFFCGMWRSLGTPPPPRLHPQMSQCR